MTTKTAAQKLRVGDIFALHGEEYILVDWKHAPPSAETVKRVILIIAPRSDPTDVFERLVSVRTKVDLIEGAPASSPKDNLDEVLMRHARSMSQKPGAKDERG